MFDKVPASELSLGLTLAWLKLDPKLSDDELFKLVFVYLMARERGLQGGLVS